MVSDRRSWLLLALIAALPIFLFFSFQAAFKAREYQRKLLSDAEAEVTLISARADGIVRETNSAIHALATTARLMADDPVSASSRAREIRAQYPGWVDVIVVDNRSGLRLVELRPGPVATALPALAKGATGKTLTRDPACRCVTLSRGFVSQSGEPRTLHVRLDHRVFLQLLPPPQGKYEVAALTDDEGRFIARSVSDAGRFGTLGSTFLQSASRSSGSHGIYTGKTLEGVQNYTAFARSPLTGWVTHLALKAQRIDTPQALFWTMIGLAALISLALAALLYYVARKQIDLTRNLTRRAQESQKLEALGQLTGGMAHDFNNLLTPIVGALDRLVHSERLNDREKRFARGALESAERAATLTRQLLSFSRRQKLEIGPVDVVRALDEVCGLAGQSLGPNYQLACMVHPQAGYIATDKVQFELATLNLVLNARDALPDGGAITIHAVAGAEPGWLTVSVSDSGAGMDEATLRRAREPFFTTKAQGFGTGLGLAQVAEVVAQSGGRLDIDSGIGRGTTVSLTLRAIDAPEAEARASGQAKLRPLRLLIVDDEASVRETLVQMVESDGHVVESVSNGQTALAALDHDRPDLLLCDFAMPGLNGAQVVAGARLRHPGLACLLITGHWDSDALAEAGVDCHILRKPFTQDALRAAMREALEQAAATD